MSDGRKVFKLNFIRCYKAKRTVGFSPMDYNGIQIGAV